MEELYYSYSEDKGADLRHCFRICKKPVFPERGSLQGNPHDSPDQLYLSKVTPVYTLTNKEGELFIIIINSSVGKTST